MTTAIRIRDIKIVATIKETGQQSIRKIAKIAGLSKDKVQHGLNAILKRNIHPESEFWETKAGQEWLRILVFGVLLEFGIKGNQGADRISSFFERIRLDKHIGVSPTSLRTLLKRMEELLVRYQKEHESECVGKSSLEIIASGDETFFKDMMVLVMMDLNSGYILVEEEAIDRSYETWRSKVEGRMKELGLTARHFISDRGKSLMKLALSCLGCAAGADIFHGQYDISKWLGMGFYRRPSRKKVKKVRKSIGIVEK
jgi:DNA-binding Lrp family transcriptional regulator